MSRLICQEGYVKSEMSSMICQEWYIKSDMSRVICQEWYVKNNMSGVKCHGWYVMIDMLRVIFLIVRWIGWWLARCSIHLQDVTTLRPCSASRNFYLMHWFFALYFMHYSSMHIFLLIFIYWFYSLYIVYAYCYSKLSYPFCKFHKIHLFFCIIVYA